MTIDPALNRAFISLSHSLLQYVGENSPWIAGDLDHATEAKLHELVVEQQQQAGKLADLIIQQTSFFDQGTYPTEYTDLQYLSFSFFQDKLVADQKAVLNDVKQAIQTCGTDSNIGKQLVEIEQQVESTIASLAELGVSASA